VNYISDKVKQKMKLPDRIHMFRLDFEIPIGQGERLPGL
jgi:hypothetical protein